MSHWPIRNLMTTDVITAPDDTPVAEVAAILAERRISAVPIVDRFDVVIGVVSWTDLHRTIDPADRDDNAPRGRLRRDRPAEVRWPDLAAREVMSAPPVTIRPDASLSAAGRLMHHHDIGRLLVTDRERRLLGIVTRRDLLKVHGRLDAVIRDEVVRRILRRTLKIKPDRVQVTVDDGVVTLTGRTGRRSTTLAAVGLTEAVAGVTRVVDRLTFDTDDTIGAPIPRAAVHDPLDGWWVGRREDDQGPSAAADQIGHGAGTPGFIGDIVDEWGRQSFPASDPPMNW
jgi:CBS domain-containing protein